MDRMNIIKSINIVDVVEKIKKKENKIIFEDSLVRIFDKVEKHNNIRITRISLVANSVEGITLNNNQEFTFIWGVSEDGSDHITQFFNTSKGNEAFDQREKERLKNLLERSRSFLLEEWDRCLEMIKEQA